MPAAAQDASCIIPGVEHRNAQIAPRQLKGNRAANDAATHDDNVVVSRHYLSSKSAGAMHWTGLLQRFYEFIGERTPLSRQILRANHVVAISSWAWLRNR